MTVITIAIWAAVTYFLYNRFINSLDVATITWTDDKTGETEDRESHVLNNGAMVQLAIAIAWTAFSFWLVGRQAIEYFYYY